MPPKMPPLYIKEKEIHSVVLFDISGSMDRFMEPPTNLRKKFEGEAKEEKNYKTYSLLVFNNTPAVICQEQNQTTYYNTIIGLKCSGGTDISQAIRKSNEYLASMSKKYPGSILMFEIWTDNENTEGT